MIRRASQGQNATSVTWEKLYVFLVHEYFRTLKYCEQFLRQIILCYFLQIRIAGSNAIFAAVTEISDSILKGAEANGFNGMVNFNSTNNSCLLGDLHII